MTKEESDAPAKKRTPRPILGVENGRFQDRLREAVGPQSVRGFSRACGISESVMRSYLAGKSDPTRLALIAMAYKAGVMLEWLATGHGPKTEQEAHAERHGELDLDLLEGLVATVRRALMDAHAELPPDVEGRVIRLLYLAGLERGQINQKMVSEVLRLVA